MVVSFPKVIAVIKENGFDIDWKDVYSKLDEVRGISNDFIKDMLSE
jgi:hypothetical protein